MTDNKLITLYINSKEITDWQFNSIVGFVSRFHRENLDQIEIICEKFPLQLNGKISNLTSTAREYFKVWNKIGAMRNLRLLKKERNNDKTNR